MLKSHHVSVYTYIFPLKIKVTIFKKSAIRQIIGHIQNAFVSNRFYKGELSYCQTFNYYYQTKDYKLLKSIY